MLRNVTTEADHDFNTGPVMRHFLLTLVQLLKEPAWKSNEVTQGLEGGIYTWVEITDILNEVQMVKDVVFYSF